MVLHFFISSRRMIRKTFNACLLIASASVFFVIVSHLTSPFFFLDATHSNPKNKTEVLL